MELGSVLFQNLSEFSSVDLGNNRLISLAAPSLQTVSLTISLNLMSQTMAITIQAMCNDLILFLGPCEYP